MLETLCECTESTSFESLVELELISDADVYLFFDKGIRGWVSKI